MASIARLVVSLGANISDFTTDMQRAGRISERELAKMERQSKQLNDKWNTNFKLAGAAVAAGLVIATKSAIDFEKSINEISTLLDGDVGLKDLANEVKAVSLEFGKSTGEEAKALYQIISAGATTAAERTELLTQANKLAVGGITDVETAADGLTGVINAYGNAAESAERISDIMFTTMRLGKTTIGEISAKINEVTPLAAKLGVEFGEVGAALATVTAITGNTSTATTQLKATFAALLAPAEEGKALFTKLGIAFGEAGIAAKGGLLPYLQDLFEKTGGNVVQLKKMTGSIESVQAILALATNNFGNFADAMDEVDKAAGATQAALEKVMAGTEFKVARATAAFEALGLALGTRLLTSVSALADTFAQNIDKVIVIAENLVVVIGTRLVIAFIAAAKAASAAGKGIATAMAIAGGWLGVVAQAVALLYINFDRLAGQENSVGKVFRVIGFVAELAAAAIAAVSLQVVNFSTLLTNVAQLVITPVSSALKSLSQAMAQISAGDFSGALNTLQSSGLQWWDDLGEAASRIKETFGEIGVGVDVLTSGFMSAKSTFADWGRGVGEVTDALDKLDARLFPVVAATEKFVAELTKLRNDAATAGKSAEWLAEREIRLAKEFQRTTIAILGQGDAVKNTGEWTDEMATALDTLLDSLFPMEAQQKEWNKQLDDLKVALAAGKISADKFAKSVSRIKAAMFAASPEGFANQLKTKFQPAMTAAAKSIAASNKELDEITKEFEKVESATDSLVDSLFPLEAATRKYNEDLEMLRHRAEKAGWSALRLAEAERQLAIDFRETTASITNQSDILATALDEGVRILERTFTDMWSGMLDGSMTAFEGIEEGFKALMANMIHQATTQKIMVNIQQGLQGKNPITAANPTGGVDWTQLGESIALFAGVIAGTTIGGGGEHAQQGASTGAAIGSIWGPWFGALGGLVGGWFGGEADKGNFEFGDSVNELLWSQIGLGSVGKFLDKIDPFSGWANEIAAKLIGLERPPVLQVTGFDTSELSDSDRDDIVSSIFGDTHLRSRRIDDDIMAGIIDSITQLNAALAEFLSDDHISAITMALEDWGLRMEGAGVDMETALGSRFGVILGTFSQELQDFVNESEDLAGRFERLQVGSAIEKLMADMPDLFSGRTLAEFLAVTEGFAEGMGSITDGFNEVLRLVNIVGSVLASLRDFAASDLGTDYGALATGQNVSLTEALAGMNIGLMDAVANFDGSIESLQAIGMMALSIREGELKLLAQIDAIASGLEASLDKLLADILNIGAPDKTSEQLLSEAQSLIDTVGAARTPEEIAALGQQFESLVRAISSDDQTAMQGQLVEAIEAFRESAADNLAAQRQEVLDNALETRSMLDGFLTWIGDTLDIIAGSNQAAADSLAQITTEGINQRNDDSTPLDVVMGEGLNDIASEISSIGPVVAGAIRQGIQGVNINVTVASDGGLVTE